MNIPLATFSVSFNDCFQKLAIRQRWHEEPGCYVAIKKQDVSMMILLTKPCSSARLCMGNVITIGRRSSGYGAAPVPSGKPTTALALRDIRQWGSPIYLKERSETTL
jgi:hypothetical protein